MEAEGRGSVCASKIGSEKSVICFALCLVSLITRGLQNNVHSNFACCLTQTIFKRITKMEKGVTLFKNL